MIHLISSVLTFHHSSIFFLTAAFLASRTPSPGKRLTQAVAEPDACLTKHTLSLFWDQESSSLSCGLKSRGARLHAFKRELNPSASSSHTASKLEVFLSPARGCLALGLASAWLPKCFPAYVSLGNHKMLGCLAGLFILSFVLLHRAWHSTGGFSSGSEKPPEGRTVVSVPAAFPVPCV